LPPDEQQQQSPPTPRSTPQSDQNQDEPVLHDTFDNRDRRDSADRPERRAETATEETFETFSVEPGDPETEQVPLPESELAESPFQTAPGPRFEAGAEDDARRERPRRGRRGGRRGARHDEPEERRRGRRPEENSDADEPAPAGLDDPVEELVAAEESARGDGDGGYGLEGQQPDQSLETNSAQEDELVEDDAEGAPPEREENDDEEIDKLTDWNVPSWTELIGSLYRPDR
jgi:hypothetical protein